MGFGVAGPCGAAAVAEITLWWDTREKTRVATGRSYQKKSPAVGVPCLGFTGKGRTIHPGKTGGGRVLVGCPGRPGVG